jgi:hypothetical protein
VLELEGRVEVGGDEGECWSWRSVGVERWRWVGRGGLKERWCWKREMESDSAGRWRWRAPGIWTWGEMVLENGDEKRKKSKEGRR